MTSAVTSTSGPAPNGVRRAVASSFVGTAIEWYDFFIYGTAAALVFGPQFFPAGSELAATLAAFATLAVGFVARPFGSAIIGHFGDRTGRKSMLVVSLLLMGAATIGIGLLPTYDTHRGLGPPPPGRAPVPAGDRGRRRVGRRRADGDRARAPRQGRPLRLGAADGRPCRGHPRQRRLPAVSRSC